MVVRNKGLPGQQTLAWDDENRLSQVLDGKGDLLESYWYGVKGTRVKKTSGGATTYTFFAHYEEEVTGVVTTTVSHYSFGGLRFAVKRGSDLFHLHGDHLGSTSLTTDAAGAATASRTYYAYGAERSSTGELKTDRTFTGQKADGTGLMYYNARYYDPALGTFVSPDSIVPNLASVIDHNRFLYASGSPLNYINPTGYASTESTREWEHKNRWYNAHGWYLGGDHWDIRGPALITTKQNATDVLNRAGIFPQGNWPNDNHLIYLAKGSSQFGSQIEAHFGPSVNGLEHIRNMLPNGAVNWYWKKEADPPIYPQLFNRCGFGRPGACTLNEGVEFYEVLFDNSTPHRIATAAVHEIAHEIHYACIVNCDAINGGRNALMALGYSPTAYATDLTRGIPALEYWAEAVGIWLYRDKYPGLQGSLLDPSAAKMIHWVTDVFRPTNLPQPISVDLLR